MLRNRERPIAQDAGSVPIGSGDYLRHERVLEAPDRKAMATDLLFPCRFSVLRWVATDAEILCGPPFVRSFNDIFYAAQCEKGYPEDVSAAAGANLLCGISWKRRNKLVG